jgi:hypothetical protein
MNTNTILYSARHLSGRRTGAMLRGVFLISVGLAGCTNDEADAVAAADGTYPLDADYATDAAYAGVYGDAWGAGLYSAGAGAGASLADAGATAGAKDPISAIHALAQGSTDVCPGQVTATPTTVNTTCGSGGKSGEVPAGVTLNFQGCQLQGGGTLDGNVTLSRTETPSNTACDESTTLAVTYQVNVSNLSYLASGGNRTVINSLTSTGTYNRSLDKPPSSITSQLNATIVRSNSAGNEISNRTLSGNTTFTLSGSAPNINVVANSNLSVSAANNGGQGTLTMNSLTKTPSCCHATAGTVTVSGTESSTYQFGPSCGDATKDGASISLGACP